MATVEIEGDDVVIKLRPLEKLGAFHGDVRVPLQTVKGVRVVDKPFEHLRGIRAPGTGLPRRIALGTWRRRDGKSFAAVYGKRRGVVIELADGQAYDRIILSADDPESVASRL